MASIIVHQDEPSSAAAAAVTPMIMATDAGGVAHVAPAPIRARRLSSVNGSHKRREANVNRPENTRWAQQKLPMWEPVLTLTWSIGICFFVAATCLVIGIAIVATSSSITTLRVVYDSGSDTNLADHGDAQAQQAGGNITNLANCLLDTAEAANSFHADHTCYITMTLPAAITGGTYIYYELAGYHQHHRRFVSSVDRSQFIDEWREDVPITMCAPLETLTSPSCHVGLCDAATTQTRKAFPCGIVANTMFNDIFWLHSGTLPNSTTASLGPRDLVSKGAARTYASHNSKNPTWAIDATDAYLPVWHNPNMSRIIPSPVQGDGQRSQLTPDYTNSTAWVHDPLDPLVGAGAGLENEHWRVWVEGAANQPFQKAYGKIARDLPAGTTLVFAVQSNYFVRSFGGSKALVVRERSWLGSANTALGGVFLAVGAVFALAATLFVVRKCTNARPLGDSRALAWKMDARRRSTVL